MKKIKKYTKPLWYGITIAPLIAISKSTFAADLLSKALDGDVQDSLGSEANFWKLFTLVAIVLATGGAVAAKNPMVFISVLAIAFIPAFLIRAFVF